MFVSQFHMIFFFSFNGHNICMDTKTGLEHVSKHAVKQIMQRQTYIKKTGTVT